MEILIGGLALFAAVVIAVVLALAAFRAGTRRQEKSGSLAYPAPGIAAGLTRRITGLYAEAPPAAQHPLTVGRDPHAAPARNGAPSSWR